MDPVLVVVIVAVAYVCVRALRALFTSSRQYYAVVMLRTASGDGVCVSEFTIPRGVAWELCEELSEWARTYVGQSLYVVRPRAHTQEVDLQSVGACAALTRVIADRVPAVQRLSLFDTDNTMSVGRRAAPVALQACFGDEHPTDERPRVEFIVHIRLNNRPHAE